MGAPVKPHPATLAPVPEGGQWSVQVVTTRIMETILMDLPIVHEAEHSFELITVSRLVSIAEQF